MLHITIGTAPTEPPSLEPDLRMVKVALLYADKVILCSSGYSRKTFDTDATSTPRHSAIYLLKQQL